MSIAELQLPLFPGVHPWLGEAERRMSADHLAARQELMAAVAASELGRMEQKVAYILSQFPETRESDTILAVRYWKRFQSDVLTEWDRLDLDVLFDLDHFETISRIRRHIQNDLRLYAASQSTRQARNELQMEFFQYVDAHRSAPAEIRVYLDETTGSADSKYVGVGGVVAMNWKQYEKHWSKLTRWRERCGWPETIRFTDTGSADQPKALALLNELAGHRSGLLFVGYALPSKPAMLHATLVTLMTQVVVDAVRHMAAIGCLPEPRRLILVKEADTTFDVAHLGSVERLLGEMLAREFGGQVFLGEVVPLPKGREVFLECADLIAGGMRRRLTNSGRNPKDVLAEAVFNTTGFQDPRDNGIVFKAHVT